MMTITGDISQGNQVSELVSSRRGYGKNRYRGPKPPFIWSHVYQFNVYVLDCMLDLLGSSRKRDLLSAIEGYILQYGCLTGREIITYI